MLAIRHQFRDTLDAMIVCVFGRGKEEAIHNGAPDWDGLGQSVWKVFATAGGVDEDNARERGSISISAALSWD